jgi:anti-anti-sigma regulatory factor
MLRLTEVIHHDRGVTLRVEGNIVAESTELLERECLAAMQRSTSVRLDLGGVMYVDSRGAELLSALPLRNCALVNCPPLLRELLDDGAAR